MVLRLRQSSIVMVGPMVVAVICYFLVGGYARARSEVNRTSVYFTADSGASGTSADIEITEGENKTEETNKAAADEENEFLAT